MLTEDRVLTYIKRHLGFPHRIIELPDDEIMDHIKEYTLREFSMYDPDVKKVQVSFLASNLAFGRENEYYIYDPDDREILNIKDVYFSTGDLAFHGHPYIGPMGLDSLAEWALQTEISRMVNYFSTYNRITEFISPNVVRVSPAPETTEIGIAEYERVHMEHFGTIPNDIQMLFCQFATADIKILLGEIREVYEGNLKTPYGEIPISRDIGDKGRAEKEKIIDKLEEAKLPNVIIDIG